VVSGTCDAVSEELNGRDEEPCGCGGDGVFQVLGKAGVTVQPCQGALDDPTARETFEAGGDILSLDDFEGPFSEAE
jgi:hypothetical protein